jgi:hypothetical protein
MMTSRVVNLTDHIDERKADTCIRQLIAFDEVNQREPIRLVICSDGADFDATKPLIATLRDRIRAPVVTVGVDRVYSGSLSVLLSGTVRVAYRGCQFLFHEVYYDTFPSHIDRLSAYEARKLADLLDLDDREYFTNCTYVGKHHVCPCKLSASDLHEKAGLSPDRELIIEANTARRLGFLDHVVKNVGGIKRVESRIKRIFNSK